MGFFRGSLSIVLGLVLFLLFLAGNLIFTLNLSLDYENIHSELSSVAKGIIEKDSEKEINLTINERIGLMNNYCKTNSEFVFSEKGYTFTIPCEIILQGHDVIEEYMIDSFVEEIYYKDYDCNFWKCFNEGLPFFLVSKMAKNYWLSKFYLILFLSLGLLILIFLFIEHKVDFPVIIGALLSISALPLIGIEGFFSLFNNSLFQFISVFFSQSYVVFMFSLFLGLGLFFIGISLKTFKFGMKISNLFTKDKEDISSEDKKISKKDFKKILREKTLKFKNIFTKKKSK